MENDISKYFCEMQSEFYHYMIVFGGLQPKTSHDYISRLKFLSHIYRLDSSLTKDEIRLILAKEDINRHNRNVYSSKKSISDFSAGLHKFLEFIQSDYKKMYEKSILSEVRGVEKSKVLTETEKTTIIQSRIGQGLFRKNLIEYWQGCSVTGCSKIDLLIASHIKPWRVSDNTERIDTFNGLLLLPNYDKLFDLGYISFDMKGKVLCSSLLSDEDKKFLKLDNNICLMNIEDKHIQYLKYHNEFCFIR